MYSGDPLPRALWVSVRVNRQWKILCVSLSTWPVVRCLPGTRIDTRWSQHHNTCGNTYRNTSPKRFQVSTRLLVVPRWDALISRGVFYSSSLVGTSNSMVCSAYICNIVECLVGLVGSWLSVRKKNWGNRISFLDYCEKDNTHLVVFSICLRWSQLNW